MFIGGGGSAGGSSAGELGRYKGGALGLGNLGMDQAVSILFSDQLVLDYFIVSCASIPDAVTPGPYSCPPAAFMLRES